MKRPNHLVASLLLSTGLTLLSHASFANDTNESQGSLHKYGTELVRGQVPYESGGKVEYVFDSYIYHPKKPAILSTKSIEDARLNLEFGAKNSPTAITAGLNRYDGISLSAEFSESGSYQIPDDVIGFDLKLANEFDEEMTIQLASYDFDKDGNPEIIVINAAPTTGLNLSVIQYYPPLLEKHIDRPQNWQNLGTFTGQFKVVFEEKDNEMTFPIGFQGIHESYTWFKNKFIRTDDFAQ